ncbi:MAG: M20/M25/M40 family metallo-hydrolase [Patescibacteria group bacterium]|nr:M20/M25/M40 family metallo-hydrolase [Patescibacteria group bacterium]
MKNNLEQRLLSDKIEQEKHMEELIRNLDVLSSIDSFSTHEDEIRAYLKEILEKFEMKCEVDEKGNLWGESEKGKQKNILVSAHMDKVGAGNPVAHIGNRLKGRLDNALGLSIIIELLKNGLKPSVLFTVEEESDYEVVREGLPAFEERELPNGLYHAGARFAAEQLVKQLEKPSLAIVVDVTRMGKVGDGPIIYTSSGYKKPGTQSYFSPKILKKIAKIINPLGIGVSYQEGNPNDATEMASVPGMEILAVEIPVINNHTANEEADLGDVEKTIKILTSIIENFEF